MPIRSNHAVHPVFRPDLGAMAVSTDARVPVSLTREGEKLAVRNDDRGRSPRETGTG